MRGAARGREDEYTATLKSVGYVSGIAAPTVFYNASAGCRLVVHGDDFTFYGPNKELARIGKLMSLSYDIKVRAT